PTAVPTCSAPVEDAFDLVGGPLSGLLHGRVAVEDVLLHADDDVLGLDLSPGGCDRCTPARLVELDREGLDERVLRLDEFLHLVDTAGEESGFLGPAGGELPVGEVFDVGDPGRLVAGAVEDRERGAAREGVGVTAVLDREREDPDVTLQVGVALQDRVRVGAAEDGHGASSSAKASMTSTSFQFTAP